ncbi:MAG: M23 family metallopeptidase, partial [Phycicoccus sp.]
FAEVQSTSGSTLSGRFKAGARMDPAAVTALLGGHGQTVQERMTKYTPASVTVADGVTARYPANTRIRLRFRVNGTALLLKVWSFGENEPRSWELVTTDTSLTAAGRVGLFSFGSGSSATDTRVYSVGVGVGAVQAPHTHLARPIWAQVPRQIASPFATNVSPVFDADDWDELRDNGTRAHRGLDMYVPIGTPVYAMTPGTIDSFMPGFGAQPVDHLVGGGYQLRVNTPDGRLRYGYAHLGPKAPASAALAFAPGIEPGVTVVQGQLLGWSGESGSTASGPHLHVDIRDLAGVVDDDPYANYAATLGTEDGPRFDPYPSIIAASPGPPGPVGAATLGVIAAGVAVTSTSRKRAAAAASGPAGAGATAAARKAAR